MTEGMSQAQHDAIKKAWDLIGEHFDHALLVLEWEIHDREELTDGHISYWHGGALPALGLAEYAKFKILSGEPAEHEP